MIILILGSLTIALVAICWWVLYPQHMRPKYILTLIMVLIAVLALVIWAGQNNIDLWSM